MKTNRFIFILLMFLLPVAFLSAGLALALNSRQPEAPQAALNLSLSIFSTPTGLTNRIVDITHAGDQRIFAAEQEGRIWIFEPDGTQVITPFLDIRSKVYDGGNEQGLLGLAFHPDYETNGYFYVNYNREHATSSLRGDTIVSRFQVSPDPNISYITETVLLIIDQPASNHNGGDLAFGSDGFLYISAGDGGGSGDPFESGQELETLLGKILRIDVDSGPGRPPDPTCSARTLLATGYTVPTGTVGNPYADGPNGDCDEIWDWGLRNPWRFSFDSLNGDMYIGDVGQGTWEEIDYHAVVTPGGMNFGWDCYEGFHSYELSGCGPFSSYDAPIFEYQQLSGNCSVTGGFVYRGSIYPQMYGYYLFADYCSGWMWSSIYTGTWTTTFLGDKGGDFTTFGEGADGELFIALGDTSPSLQVIIYRIQEDTVAPAAVTDLDAQVSGPDIDLDWSAVTLDVLGGSTTIGGYEVHRSTTPYFTPDGATLLATVGSAAYTDPVASGNVYYYLVLAVDTEGYASAASNEVGAFPYSLFPGSP